MAAFDWSEFLKLANQLSANADEASHRTSISRAYYCAYHKASERAVANGYRNEEIHFKLWELYRKNTDVTCRQLTDIGTRMKKERLAADYSSTASGISDRMEDQLRRAYKFMALLSTLPAGLPFP